MSKDIASRSAVTSKNLTRKGNGTGDVEKGEQTLGEGGEVGSKYSANLTQWPNKSLNRNAGPDRPSANNGMIPVPDQSVRKTGKIG